jgi:hypothetical protein
MSRSTDTRKLALWRRRFERFSRGELAVGPFCARERVSVASFYYWREKAGGCCRGGEGRPQTDRRSVFQPVTVVPTGSAELTAEAAPAIRIELPGGARIEVRTGDLEVVRAVVGVVARSDDGRHGSDGAC